MTSLLFDSQVKWDVMNRKDVPKKVKQIPTAPLVLIWDMILVVTVACSTSVETKNIQIKGGTVERTAFIRPVPWLKSLSYMI